MSWNCAKTLKILQEINKRCQCRASF